MKTKVAMLFGGKSVEHEVSVITGIQALLAMDNDKYDVTAVYMNKKNEMYVGDDIGKIESYKDIDGLIARSHRVIPVNNDGKVQLVSYPPKKFGKNITIDVDVVFPAVHGTNVEDGALQGFLKTIGVPFVGCDVTASAV
ncbi:MAG: D-alanine--D-alanine ligase, partial [Clostridiales bacterium]|nr:D-alanine--D-alanine ligase [Clostridiales bacterium]